MPLTEHKTNNEVLRLAKAIPTLLSSIKDRKCRYFEHFTRENSIHRVILEGKIKGERGKGRPKIATFFLLFQYLFGVENRHGNICNESKGFLQN